MAKFDENGKWTWKASELPKPHITYCRNLDGSLKKDNKGNPIEFKASPSSSANLKKVETLEWIAGGVGLALIVTFWVGSFYLLLG